MHINIQVIKVTKPEKVKTAKGGYKSLEITYKDLSDGKVGGHKLVDFKYPEVFDAVSLAKEDSVYSVNKEKIDGYWAWVAVKELDSVPVEDTPASTVTRGTEKVPVATKQQWVPDEVRQRYIVRQSTLGHAVALLGPGASFDAVRNLAKAMEAHVFGEESVVVADVE